MKNKTKNATDIQNSDNRKRTVPAIIAALALCVSGSARAGVDTTTILNNEIMLNDSLWAMYVDSNSADTQFWINGFWVYPNSMAGWAAGAGPSSAAAELFLWRQKHNYTNPGADATTNSWLRSTSQASTNTMLTHIGPDGLFETAALPDTQTSLIELCAAYLDLRDTLDPTTRKNWLNAMMRMTNYLIVDGDLPDPAKTGWQGTSGWYTNGNYELMEAELLYQMYLATGDIRYKNLFDTQWAATLNPDAGRWPNFGLRYTVNPTLPDGSDGSGYLVESNGTTYGYDGDYTQYQSTIAGRLYLMLPDTARLRLTNLLVNQLLPYVDKSTWVLDATNGSRHSLHLGFMTESMNLLAWFGGRTDLAGYSRSQFTAQINGNFLGNAFQNWGSPGIYHAYGNNVAVTLQADLVGTSLPVPPNTPTAVASNGQIALSWPISIGAISYNVKRATSSAGPYTTIASSPPPIYTDTTASNGTTYYYEVSAVNRVGESTNSAFVQAAASPVAPVAPANLAVTGGNARAMLVWLQATGAGSYNLKRATVSGGPYTTIATNQIPNSVSPYIDSGLNNGLTYYYVVSASNPYGESANSPETSVTPQFLFAPRIYSAVGGSGQVQVSWWTVRGAASYNLKRSTTAGGPYTTVAPGLTGTTYTDTGLTNGTTYYYVLSAVNGTEGPNSPQAVASATPVPVPGNVLAKGSPTAITVSWATVKESSTVYASSYKVKRSTGGAYTDLATVTGNGTAASFSYVDSTAAAGTTYYYVVTAFYGTTEGRSSLSVSATLAPVTIPGTPTNLIATGSATPQVALTWTGAAGATSYNVKRSTFNGGPYVTISSGMSATNFTDTRVTLGTRYYYVVSAVNANGEGPDSTSTSAVPQ